MAKARREEAARLLALADADETTVNRLEAALHRFLLEHDGVQVETPRFKVSVVRNGGKLPIMILGDTRPEELEERFHRVIPARIELDKEEVRFALEAGEELPFARLGERGTRLVIK